jgi:hypothetical protein
LFRLQIFSHSGCQLALFIHIDTGAHHLPRSIGVRLPFTAGTTAGAIAVAHCPAFDGLGGIYVKFYNSFQLRPPPFVALKINSKIKNNHFGDVNAKIILFYNDIRTFLYDSCQN